MYMKMTQKDVMYLNQKENRAAMRITIVLSVNGGKAESIIHAKEQQQYYTDLFLGEYTCSLGNCAPLFNLLFKNACVRMTGGNKKTSTCVTEQVYQNAKPMVGAAIVLPPG